jgi:hypothetical protein
MYYETPEEELAADLAAIDRVRSLLDVVSKRGLLGDVITKHAEFALTVLEILVSTNNLKPEDKR